MEILSSTKTHPTADWIYDRLKKDFPNLSLSTVYRNLKILKKQNRILELPFGPTYDRFDANPSPHPHFICQKCEKVYDLEIYGLESHLDQAIKNTNFKFKSFSLEFCGICPECRKKPVKTT